MTHSLPLKIAAAMQELPTGERDGLRRQAIRAALENMPAAEAEKILAYAEALSKQSGGPWRITELAALETLAAIGAVLVHGNTGRMFNITRGNGIRHV